MISAEQLSQPILIVDDLPSARKIVKRLLTNIGFTVIHEAADGVEALKLLQTTQVGLIISDWDMAGMSGIDLIQALKADLALSKIPVIVLTSSADRSKVLTAKEAGAIDYLAKPVSMKALQGRLELLFSVSSKGT